MTRSSRTRHPTPKKFLHFARSADDPDLYEATLDKQGRLCLGKQYSGQCVSLKVKPFFGAGYMLLELTVAKPKE